MKSGCLILLLGLAGTFLLPHPLNWWVLTAGLVWFGIVVVVAVLGG